MTASEDRILDWFEKEGYDFFDEIEYEKSESIFDDDDIEKLVERGENFAREDLEKRYTVESAIDSFNRIWRGVIQPQWESIAKENSNKLTQELKKIARENIEQAKTKEERFKAIEELRAINPQSLGQLKTTEKRRATRAFRSLFK